MSACAYHPPLGLRCIVKGQIIGKYDIKCKIRQNHILWCQCIGVNLLTTYERNNSGAI